MKKQLLLILFITINFSLFGENTLLNSARNIVISTPAAAQAREVVRQKIANLTSADKKSVEGLVQNLHLFQIKENIFVQNGTQRTTLGRVLLDPSMQPIYETILEKYKEIKANATPQQLEAAKAFIRDATMMLKEKVGILSEEQSLPKHINFQEKPVLMETEIDTMHMVP